MSSLNGDIVSQYFKTGAVVEISSNDEGFRGSWFLGTVIRPPGNAKRRKGKVLVEYKTLMENDVGRRGLREELDLVQLRPPPPTEVRGSFKVSDDVDAYYNEGWWEGIVTEVVGKDNKYLVFFRGTREQIVFKASQLRLHREWVYGKWVPGFEQVDNASTSEKPVSTDEVKSKKQKIEHEFSPGTHVEVRSDEEGYRGAWFAATVVEKLKARKYLIEYQNFKNDKDDSKLLTEEVDSLYIRPCPPDVECVDGFKALQEVDALHNDCWWVGSIEKVLKDDKYYVYFKNTGEKLKCKHSDLRVHQEWINEKWVVSSKTPKL